MTVISHTPVAGTAVRRLLIKPIFDALESRGKLYAHHMARAAWHGSRIIMRQVSSESPDIFDFIMDLYGACDGQWNTLVTECNIAEQQLQSFLEYAATFLCNLGNYYGEDDRKFVPDLTPDILRRIASIAHAAAEKLDAIIKPLWDIPPYGFGYPGDHTESAYYPGTAPILQQEVVEVSQAMGTHAIEPENTRLQKLIVDGRPTGDLDSFRESQTAWVTDVAARVEHLIGFIEPYRDPAGIRSEWEAMVGITDKDEVARLKYLVDNSAIFLRQLPWAVAGVNDGKGPFETNLFEAPDFTSVHALELCGSVVFEAANLPNYETILENPGFKNIVIANRLSVNNNHSLPCPWVDPSELQRFKSTTHIVRFLTTAIHELLGHGSGKLLSETAPGAYNLDKENPPINPLTNKLVESHFLASLSWRSVFGKLAGTVEECRAILMSEYFMDNKQLLGIFWYNDSSEITADELLYATYLNIGVDGLQALPISPSSNTSSKTAAGVIHVDHDPSTANLTVRVDRSKIQSHGKPALSNYLCRLHIWRCTADVLSCKEFYETPCAVDGQYEEWRKIVRSKPNPKWKFVQPNTFLSGDSVEVKVYKASNEGIIQSWAGRDI